MSGQQNGDRHLMFSLLRKLVERIRVRSVSSTQFGFSGEMCISGSIDRTCKIWNVKSGQWCVHSMLLVIALFNNLLTFAV